MKKTFFFMTLCLSFFNHATTLDKQQLRQLLKIAKEKSPLYRDAELKIREATLQKEISFGNFLPKINLTAQNTYGDGTNSDTRNGRDGQFWNHNLTASLEENFFDGGSHYYQHKIKEYYRQESLLDATLTLEDLSYRVAEEYYGYLLSIKGYEIKAQKHKTLLDQFDTIRAAYLQGLKTSDDYMRFEAKVMRSKIDVASSLKQIKKNKMDLCLTLGVGPNNENLKEFHFEKAANNLSQINLPQLIEQKEKFLKDVLNNHPLLEKQKIAENIAHISTTITSLDLFPRLSIQSSLNYQLPNYPSKMGDFGSKKEGNYDWQTMFTVSFNIFDFGERRKKVEIAHIQELKQNALHHKEKLELENNIKKTTLDIEEQIEEFKISKKLLMLEEKNYKQIEKSYRNSKAAYLDMIEALQNYASAQEGVFQISYELKKSQFNMLKNQRKLYDYLQQDEK